MKTKRTAKYRVTPTNVKNGHTAPYFIIEPEKKMKRDELREAGDAEFKQRSSLAKYNNWQAVVERI